MCVAATARRRRAQMANNYRHLSKQRRPRYKRRDIHTMSMRLQRLIEKQKAMQQRKGSSKR